VLTENSPKVFKTSSSVDYPNFGARLSQITKIFVNSKLRPHQHDSASNDEFEYPLYVVLCNTPGMNPIPSAHPSSVFNSDLGLGI
jgi:hypothetical protein